MVNVIGVRFRQAGKHYYFSPGAFEIKKGDHVIVETARGVEYGEAIEGVHAVEDTKVIQPLKEIMRPASAEDDAHVAENAERQKEAFRVCQEKIRKHALDMKLIDCEITFDNSKMLFYFTADGRIDFRELVKDLAGIFRTRIELRQVGVRDETKILGGIGSCGRTLCCHSYLSDFVPVSIKMAKEQNLSLNPLKISGVCGRLMCCLKNEEEVYEELNKKLPKVGDYVLTADELRGQVHSVSILKQLVKVVVQLPNDEKEIREYAVSDLVFKPRKGREKGGKRNPEKELEELERMEREEKGERAERAKQPEKTEAQPEDGDAAACSGAEERRERPARKPRAERSEGAEQQDGLRRERPERRERGERNDRRMRDGAREVKKERADGEKRGPRPPKQERRNTAGGAAREKKSERSGGQNIVSRPDGSAPKKRSERIENRADAEALEKSAAGSERRNRRRRRKPQPGGSEAAGNPGGNGTDANA